MGATGDSIDAGDTPDPDEQLLPGGIVAPRGQGAASAAARRIRGQLTDLAEEAEQQARDEFERAVLDALAPPPPLVELARLAAFAAAEELAGHPWVSLPVPCEGGIAFLLGASSDDDGGALVSPPLADAYIDAASLSVTVDRLAPAHGDAPPSIPVPATAARALPPARGTAYWLELVDLADRLAESSVHSDPELARLDALMRFLIPGELFEHYVRLNPEFFARVAAASGRGPLESTAEPPPINNDYLPTDPSMFDVGDLEEIWNFDCASLSQAARDAGLEILESSVLPVSWDVISDAFEAVAGVSPGEWLRDLAALAEPGWQIRIRGISEAGRIRATYSVARKEPHAWVCADDSAPGCQITVGVGPEAAHRLASAPLLATGIAGASDHFVVLTAAAVSRLLTGATDPFGILATVTAAAALPWPEDAGSGAEESPRLPAVDAFAGDLESARAAVAVTSTDFAASGVPTTGLVVIACATRFWLIVPTDPWKDTIDGAANVFLYTATRELLTQTLARFVGTAEPPRVTTNP